MGLFGSKKRTTVGTSVMRVIDDDMIPDAKRTGLIKSIFADEPENTAVDHVLEELVQSVGVRAERMYSWAARGNYVHGMPSGQFFSQERGLEEVPGVLATIEGSSVSVEYVRHGPPNGLHIGWIKLIALHGYNPSTNQLAALTATKGTPVYLEDMQLVIPAALISTLEPVALEQWGSAARSGQTLTRDVAGTSMREQTLIPTPPEYSTTAVTEHVRVDYVWGGVTPGSDSFTIDLTGYSDEKDYFQAKYKVGGVTKYWIYQEGLGTYPLLDNVYRPEETSGTFFPFVYFRYGKAPEDTASESYRDAKKLVKFLGMDYDTVNTGIHDNPGIGDVEQAMMMFAVPAVTENELERRYLFEFFDNLRAANLDTNFRDIAAADIAIALNERSSKATTVVIQDSRFTMSVSTSGIYKKRKVGQIGPIGTHTSGIDTVTTEKEMYLVDATPYMVTETSTRHYYRRQISHSLYDEILVADLATTFFILGGHNTIGDDMDKILIIPLDHSITEDYSIPDREVLYARSLHFVFNSVIVTKVKWYETGLFKAILIVVMVIVTIYTYGATLKELAATIAATGVTTAMVVSALVAIVEYALTVVALRLFVKAVGVKAAFIVAIVAAVAGMYMIAETGSLAGAPWASDLLQVSSGISKAAQGVLQSDFKDLLADVSSFSEYVKQQTKLLDTANDLLDSSVHMSPFIIFGETPAEFYERTVHYGNIGTIGVSAISNYVDILLRLPKLNDSLIEGAMNDY